jgi:hypothetical protein
MFDPAASTSRRWQQAPTAIAKRRRSFSESKWRRLWDLYTNPDEPGSLDGVNGLYRAAKQRWADVSRRDVEQFLSSTEVYTLHKPARKRYPRARIVVWGLNYLWQIDLAQLSNLSKWNRGYKFVLVAVDGFNSRAMFEPLHRKTASLTTEAMERIFRRVGASPVYLASDMGTEFFNSKFQKLMNDYSVIHFPMRNIVKAAFAERMIRFLKQKIWRYFRLYNTKRWIDVLPRLEEAANRRKVRKIGGLRPIDVTYENQEAILKRLYPNTADLYATPGQIKLAIGDKVKISHTRAIFDKEYAGRWSLDNYTVARVANSNPPRYSLKDRDGDILPGTWYEHELQKVQPSLRANK